MKRLNTKLTFILLSSLLATSVGTGILVLNSQTQVLTRQLDDDGRALTQTMSNIAVEIAVGSDWLRFQDQIKAAAQRNHQVVFIKAYDDAGKLRAWHPAACAEDSWMASQPDLRQYENPIVVAEEGLPSEILGRVKVGLNNDRLAELTASSLSKLITGTIVGFSLLALVLWLSLRKQVIHPLADLDRHIATISMGDLTQPIKTDRKDELGRLAMGLETMRTNLQESYRRIEEQVVALKELDRMKDEFLASTSHELKTPLNGILGLGESMLLGSYGEITKEQQETIELMLTCANRLWKMTDSILKFSRLHREDTQDQSAPELNFLADHLQEGLADLRSNAEKSGVRVIQSIPKDLEVTYPRNELEQIIRIFVDNAIKYAAGGVVQIIAEKWEGGAQPGFQIAVRDNGPGIPASHHETVFEPFVQAGSHDTRVQGGVGLGLAIAAKLIRRIGAKVILESEVGKGACFTLLIPEGEVKVSDLKSAYKPWPVFSSSIRVQLDREIAEEPVTTTSPMARASTEACHVLVVDDESVNREVVWQALKDEFRVTRAADGASAIEVLRKQEVDIVLLDIMMPGMSGYDVLLTMQQEGLLERVPVIVLSAKASRDAVVKGLEHGASDYLGKPFHRAELLCRVRVHLQLKRQRDQLQSEVAAKTNALEVAEHASKIKTQFLANMSHEIRTPLNGILGFLELCSSSESTPEQEEYLGLMEERTKSLLTIVDDILDVAKIESKEVRVESTEIVPAELVRELAEAHAVLASQKGLTLHWQCDRACYESVQVDRKKLEQILRNLLANAVKFTKSGTLELRAGVKDGATGETKLSFEVEDSGIGIPKGKLEEIFMPFTQGDSSTTREFGGTGLGLAISRSYARMMGGDVTVKSEPGVGSTFTVAVRAYLADRAGPKDQPLRQALSA